MSKFHINKKDGTVGPCRANEGNCPFGGDEVHFTSMVAAAAGYEKSMATQTIVSHSKQVKSAATEAGFAIPKDYRVLQSDLSFQDVRELKTIPELQHLYFSARNSNPVISHSRAFNLVKAFETAEEKNSSFMGRRFKAEEPGLTDYDTLAEHVNEVNEGVPYTYPHKTTEELTKTLWNDARNIVLASRSHGFPEDEQSNYNMDRNESSLLKSLSTLTGRDSKAIRTEFIASLPVERNTLDKISDEDLAVTSARVNSFVRLSDAKKVYKNRVNREMSIRKIIANPNDKAIIADELRKGKVTRNEAIALTGKELPFF